MPLTFASLCSGYGGLDRAAIAAFGGGVMLWHAEKEQGPVKILEAHWPEVSNVGDITDARWRTWQRPDVLTMGVPCQPVSAAGRQRGDGDERWLWPYAHRAVIDLGCPLFIVFENVRNLISIEGGRLWRGILADLRAAGYAVRWLTLGACAIGFCHHRHRVFAVAEHVGGEAPLAERLAVQACGARRGQPRELLPTPAAVRYGSNRGGGMGRVGPVRESLDTWAANLLPSPAARDGDGRGERFGRYAGAVALHADRLELVPPDPTEIGPRGGRRLAPEFPEWMMGLQRGYLTDHVERGEALKAAGNGVVPQQGYAAIRLLRDGL